jgi:hypothetical protein
LVDARVLFALAALALASACSTTTSGGGGIACPALALAPPFLLYPQPGATNVPTSVGTVIMSNVGPAGGTVTLTSTGATITAGALRPAPSPLPSGVASPSGEPDAASLPTLTAGTTYTVNFTAVTVTSTSMCVVNQGSGAIGSFST